MILTNIRVTRATLEAGDDMDFLDDGKMIYKSSLRDCRYLNLYLTDPPLEWSIIYILSIIMDTQAFYLIGTQHCRCSKSELL